MTSIPSTTPGWKKNREKKKNPRETLIVGVQNPFEQHPTKGIVFFQVIAWQKILNKKRTQDECDKVPLWCNIHTE